MKKTLVGKIVSLKMKKTAVVEVERKILHKKYKKVIYRHKKYKAHYDDMKLAVGDQVKIAETRPISKTKHFVVLEKI